MDEKTDDVNAVAAALRERVGQVRSQLERVIIGQGEVIDLLLVVLLADGHLLLEGLPGLGKTLLIRSLARAIDADFNRIQFTPDLMPADITGTAVITTSADGDRGFVFERGPLFTNLLLADEINRASPKTQSALLQAMQERQVSFFGRHYPLEDPFMVFATQNPIELAGTYPLPEAQLDRFFFKVLMPAPNEKDLMAIAAQTTGAAVPEVERVLGKEEFRSYRRFIRQIPIAAPVLETLTRAVHATRPGDPRSEAVTRRYVRYGVSPRGLQALVLAAKVRACLEGRFNVSLEDVRPFWLPALRHRLILEVGAGLDGVTADGILTQIADSLLKS